MLLCCYYFYYYFRWYWYNYVLISDDLKKQITNLNILGKGPPHPAELPEFP